MATIRSIGEALLSHIEYKDNESIKIITDLIEKHKIIQDELSNINMYKKEIYKTKYENPRIENNMMYDSYIKNRQELINIWQKDKNSKAKLLDILNLKRPELETIDEIYTYQNIDLNADKAKVVKQDKDVAKVVKRDKDVAKIVKVVKEKECPPGKVLNPITKRCITDKSKKNVKEVKSVDVKPVDVKPVDVKPVDVKPIGVKTKECPPGKILNPLTNRCITDKTNKADIKPVETKAVADIKPVETKAVVDIKPVEIKVKPIKLDKICPEGKILNPLTGRCITDKTKKAVKPK